MGTVSHVEQREIDIVKKEKARALQVKTSRYGAGVCLMVVIANGTDKKIQVMSIKSNRGKVFEDKKLGCIDPSSSDHFIKNVEV